MATARDVVAVTSPIVCGGLDEEARIEECVAPAASSFTMWSKLD